MPNFPKPEPRVKVKARKDREYQAKRDACVLDVFNREQSRCEWCKCLVKHKSDPTVTEWTIGHVHEWPPRSRSGDPTNPNDCHLACVQCHGKAHGLKIAEDE